MLNWYYVTKAQYTAASTHSSENLYFLSDTKEIYRGDDLFTQSVILYTGELPATPAVGQLYINESTLEGKTYTGSAWKTVIKAVAATVTADGTDPVSGAAVAKYVTDALADAAAEAKAAFKDVSYSKTTNKLTFTTNAGGTKEVEIDNLPVDLMFTEGDETGLLQLKDASGNAIGTGVNLDLERFVKSGEYDAETKKITLYFDDAKTSKVEIDASALVDIYTGEATSTATTSVSADNKISVTVKASAVTGNKLSVKDDGLYVEETDISGKQDLISGATAGHLAGVNVNGQTTDAGVKAGGEELATTPDAITLATEKAVKTAISAEETRATAAEVAAKAAADAAQQTADANKTAIEAEVTRAKAAEETLTTDVAANKTAIEAEVTRAKAAEKELTDALTWKTTIA